jgi:hypothetical protein
MMTGDDQKSWSAQHRREKILGTRKKERQKAKGSVVTSGGEIG